MYVDNLKNINDYFVDNFILGIICFKTISSRYSSMSRENFWECWESVYLYVLTMFVINVRL